MEALKSVIHVKSSSGDFYEVQFHIEETKTRIFCHCPAGVMQQMCKHKLALIKGDATVLFDASQASELKRIIDSPVFSKILTRLSRYESELLAIEKEKALIVKREKETKSAFARELTAGIF
jgi:uncharacterized Zn finger protein